MAIFVFCRDMDNKAAVDYLSVSIRALERYVQQGSISVRYQKGKTRSTANFDQTELEVFKAELNQYYIKYYIKKIFEKSKKVIP